MEAADYLAHLRRALNRVGISYTAYVVATQILANKASTTPALARNLGITRKAVDDIVSRRNDQLFEVASPTRPKVYRLSPEGIALLGKVRQLMPHSPRKAAPPRRPRKTRHNKAQLIFEL